jgi:hypothetical protein
MAFHIKVRQNGHWVEVFRSVDIIATLAEYNSLPVPRMLLGNNGIKSGILHKQYSDNGFNYCPEWALGDGDDE